METHQPRPFTKTGKPITPFARAMRNAGYLLGGNGATAVFGVLTTIVAVRALGLKDYGVLLLIHAFAGAAATGTRLQTWQPILQLGTTLFEAQEQPRFQALLRHCLKLDMAGALVGVVIGVPLALLCGSWLGWRGHEHLAAWYVTCALFMNTGATIGVMRLADRYKMAAIADSLAALVRLVGAGLGLWLHWKLWGFLVVWYLSIVTAFTTDALFLWWLSHALPSLRGFGLFNGSWRSREPGFWKLLLPTSADQALIGLASRVDILVVGAVLGGANAAIYRTATQIGEALSQPAQLLTPALYPEFVRLREQQNGQALRQMVWKIFRGLLVFSGVIILAAVLVGPLLLAYMLGQPVADSLGLIVLMAAAGAVDLWNVPLEPLLVSFGYAHKLFLSRLVVLVLSLGLLYGFSLLWGIEGAAAAALLRKGGIFASRFVLFLALP